MRNQANNALFLAVVALVVAVVALFYAAPARAHTIPVSSCYAAAKTAGPYQSPAWRAKFRRCQQYRRDHAWNHRCGGTANTIRCVFGGAGSAAVRVARCESGLSTSATNGQYRGLFQMGSSERATYGHGSTALAQSRAARRYFVASGSDWSPWACKP